MWEKSRQKRVNGWRNWVSLAVELCVGTDRPYSHVQWPGRRLSARPLAGEKRRRQGAEETEAQRGAPAGWERLQLVLGRKRRGLQEGVAVTGRSGASRGAGMVRRLPRLGAQRRLACAFAGSTSSSCIVPLRLQRVVALVGTCVSVSGRPYGIRTRSYVMCAQSWRPRHVVDLLLAVGRTFHVARR